MRPVAATTTTQSQAQSNIIKFYDAWQCLDLIVREMLIDAY